LFSQWGQVVADAKNVGEPWTSSDLFFLRDALIRGMPIAKVAAFLGRTEDEVRTQNNAIGYRERPSAQN
jgi:hypothetical protein